MQPRDQCSNTSLLKIIFFLLPFFFFLFVYFLHFSLFLFLFFLSLFLRALLSEGSGVFALALFEFRDLFFGTESRRQRRKEGDRDTESRKRTALIETSRSFGEFEARAK